MVNVDCVIDNQLRTASMVYWFACLPKLGPYSWSNQRL